VIGPDLTHFGGRRTIGAGAAPNSEGFLGGWIVDSQGIKPGNHMPPIELPARDLQDLIDYLESLE
jgi:cytochrome c oxidase subunit 2